MRKLRPKEVKFGYPRDVLRLVKASPPKILLGNTKLIFNQN